MTLIGLVVVLLVVGVALCRQPFVTLSPSIASSSTSAVARASMASEISRRKSRTYALLVNADAGSNGLGSAFACFRAMASSNRSTILLVSITAAVPTY